MCEPENSATVWPPAPKTAATLQPAFHLVHGRGYLIAQCVNIIAAVVYGIMCLRYPDIGDGRYQLQVIVDGFHLSSLLYLCTFIASGILFLSYLYHAYKSVSELGADGLPDTPSWMVGWFFVPMKNCYMPLRMMQSLWRASKVTPHVGNGFRWQENPNSPLITSWWCSYVAWGFAAGLAVFCVPDDVISGVASLVGLVPSVLSLLIIHSIQRRQEQSAKALGFEIISDPSRF